MNLLRPESSEQYLKAAKQSVKWSTLAEIISRGTTPILYLVLTTILQPADFAVLAVSFLLINFVQILWDAGLGRSLIQIDETLLDVANAVYWVNLILSTGIYILIMLFAEPISKFLNVAAAAQVLPVIGIYIVLQAGASVQQAVMVRAFMFRSILLAKLSTSFVPVLIAVPLAFRGFGIWSLVFGYLLGGSVALIVYWILSPWRPSLSINWLALKNIRVFGIWSFSEGVAAWFFTWGDNLLVGKYFGADMLGIYTISWNLVAMIFGLFINPLMPIFYSMYSRIRYHDLFLKNVFLKSTGFLAFLSLPLSLFLFLFSGYFVPFWLGDENSNALYVIRVISLLYGIFGIVALNPELYRAMGRPDLSAKLMLFSVAVYLPAYLLVIPFGFRSFVLSRFILGCLTIPAHFILIKMLLGFEWKLFFTNYWWVGCGLFLVVLLAYSLEHILPVSPFQWARGVIIGGACAIVYLLNAWVLKKQFVLEVVRNIREAL